MRLVTHDYNCVSTLRLQCTISAILHLSAACRSVLAESDSPCDRGFPIMGIADNPREVSKTDGKKERVG